VAQTIYDFQVTTIEGKKISLDSFRGQVLVIVNVASRCGFTPQYKGLESLYKSYKEQGFSVLGFPCNQFGSQEPGSEEEIKSFCSLTYDVSFPLFAKVEVNGPQADPLFQFLKSEGKGILGTEAIKWNFTKFLVGRKGEVVERFSPATDPDKLRSSIEKALKNPSA
jgi:glutathione peroxidase